MVDVGSVGDMTDKSVFTDDEWTSVVEGPTSAGFLVVTASPGGMFRETFAMSKAYAEARAAHGASELLDAVVSSKPKVDRTHHGSVDEQRVAALAHVREAVGLVALKATPEEVGDYRRFVLTLAEKVAAAHREGGQDVSSPEAKAIEEIRDALGAGSDQGAAG